MLKITGYVMVFVSIGVLGAIASATTIQGIGLLVYYGKLGDIWV
ncbi:hypothetical protein ACEN9D_05220 [Pseudomonas sp. CT11-2]